MALERKVVVKLVELLQIGLIRFVDREGKAEHKLGQVLPVLVVQLLFLVILEHLQILRERIRLGFEVRPLIRKLQIRRPFLANHQVRVLLPRLPAQQVPGLDHLREVPPPFGVQLLLQKRVFVEVEVLAVELRVGQLVLRALEQNVLEGQLVQARLELDFEHELASREGHVDHQDVALLRLVEDDRYDGEVAVQI